MSDTDDEVVESSIFSDNPEDLFYESLSKKIKSLKEKGVAIVKNHAVYPQSEDMKFLDEVEKRTILLKLEELTLQNERAKLQDELMKKQENRETICVRLEQARLNLQVYLQCSEMGDSNHQVLDGIAENLMILKEINNIKTESTAIDSMEDPLNYEEIFHMTCKDVKNAIEKTNVLDVMRMAKKNGWDIRISEDEVAVFKDGKRIMELDGRDFENLFVKHENGKCAVDKTIKDNKENKSCKAKKKASKKSKE